MIEEKVENISLNKQAWSRYFARVLDIFLGTIIVLFMFEIFFIAVSLIFGYYANPLEQAPDIIFRIIEMLGMAIYFFIEAYIISKYGTTPAKKLFGISLSNKNGERLDYKTSLGRGFTLWFKGLALGLPIISFITLAFAYSNFTQDGQTSWDRDYEVTVYHKPISTTRFIIGTTLWLLLIVLTINLHQRTLLSLLKY